MQPQGLHRWIAGTREESRLMPDALARCNQLELPLGSVPHLVQEAVQFIGRHLGSHANPVFVITLHPVFGGTGIQGAI